jgi:hypothetical protein
MVSTTTATSGGNTVVLTDVVYDSSYSLADYDYGSVKEIVLQLDGNVGYGFGGCVMLGNWAAQHSYSASDLSADNTITIQVTNPQDTIKIFNYWGTMNLVSVTLVME